MNKSGAPAFWAVLVVWAGSTIAGHADVYARPATASEQAEIESLLIEERQRSLSPSVLGAAEVDEQEDEQQEDEPHEIESDEDEEPARRYTTRDERRDEGHRYEFGEWLSLAAIAELEYESERLTNFEDDASDTESESPWSFEIVVELTPLDWLSAEVVYEYDSELDDFELDEAILALEFGDFELELGELFVPFGEYFSHFVSGPSIEFAETGGRSVVISYGPSDAFDLALFAYKGLARKEGRSGQEYDWGFALEMAPNEIATVGLSYLSDLADAEEMLLEDEGNRYARKVAAASGYILIGSDNVEWSAEFVKALDKFAELDGNANKPEAWNSELAWFPQDALGYALRWEKSKELEDEPDERYGLALMWQVIPRVFFTVEYLRGRFERGLAEDSLEREARRIHQYGAQLSIEL